MRNVEYAPMHRIQIEETTIKDFHCKACHLAKFEAIVSRTALVKPTEFFQYVFWDTIEHSPIGYGGYRYSLHGTDAYTTYKWLILANNRKEAMEKLRGWKKTVEISSGGYKVQITCFNNAREFISQQTKDWAREDGFVLRTSAPYASQQNGMIEKVGKDLMDAARATCSETGLPETLWPLSMEASIYVNNILPTAALEGGISPIEKMFKAIKVDNKFSINHTRTWGCVAYVKKPEQKRVRSEKMSAKAMQGHLVGLKGLNGHIYKIYLPEDGKVVRARDVGFHENALGLEYHKPRPQSLRPNSNHDLRTQWPANCEKPTARKPETTQPTARKLVAIQPEKNTQRKISQQ